MLDEQQDAESILLPSDISDRNKSHLLAWLRNEYGVESTKKLQIENFSALSSVDQQRSCLSEFLAWFRREFPYYRDECGHCQTKGCKYQGNQLPTKEEREFSSWIDSTEVSFCEKCQKQSRFPRYLAAMEICRRRRGRCSEYSLLLYRILRVCGHRSRWVVDWANHVWAEVWMDNRWVHLDPCEAAIDNNLLYQGWGKKQTYILAFEAPSSSAIVSKENTMTSDNSFKISDVTQAYTSDNLRRLVDGTTAEVITLSLQRANEDLESYPLSELLAQYNMSVM